MNNLKPATLQTSHVELIRKIEDVLKEATGKNIQLIAYESTSLGWFESWG